MADYFVSRLTDEQIRSFLAKEFPEPKYSDIYYFKEEKTGVRASVESHGVTFDNTLNIVLGDFEVRGAVDTVRWCQYLYGIFKEPWKEAYIKHCLSKVGIS